MLSPRAWVVWLDAPPLKLSELGRSCRPLTNLPYGLGLTVVSLLLVVLRYRSFLYYVSYSNTLEPFQEDIYILDTTETFRLSAAS
jgi:hypothetical protein